MVLYLNKMKAELFPYLVRILEVLFTWVGERLLVLYLDVIPEAGSHLDIIPEVGSLYLVIL